MLTERERKTPAAATGFLSAHPQRTVLVDMNPTKHHTFPVLVVLVALFSMTACGNAVDTQATSTEAGINAEPSDFLIEPEMQQVGICVDASNSMNPVVKEATLDAIRALPGRVSDTTDESLPQDGLHLVVRQVGGDSFDLRWQRLNVTLPAIPGLLPAQAPGLDLDAYNAAKAARAGASDVRSTAAGARAESRPEFDEQVGDVDYLADGGSDIVGCLIATANSFDSALPSQLVLVTDLDHRGDINVEADLANTSIVVIHDAQDQSIRDEQRSALRAVVESLGAGPSALTFHESSQIPSLIEGSVRP